MTPEDYEKATPSEWNAYLAESKLANMIIKMLLTNIRSMAEAEHVLQDGLQDFLAAIEIDELPENVQDMRAVLEVKLVKLRLASDVIATNIKEIGSRLKAL